MNPLKERLRAGKPVVGCLITMPSVNMTQLLATSGLDFLFIDMEHAPIGIETVHAMVTATGGTGCTPLVRVPMDATWLAKPVMDAGAYGIILPMVCSKADAELSVKITRYPPEGKRGWGPFYAPYRWDMTVPSYLEAANREMLNVVLIEDIRAVDNIDEILSVPGIDVASIAPFDLSISVGRSEEHTSELQSLMRNSSAVLCLKKKQTH